MISKLSHKDFSDTVNRYYSSKSGLENFTYIDTEDYGDINMSYRRNTYM